MQLLTIIRSLLLASDDIHEMQYYIFEKSIDPSTPLKAIFTEEIAKRLRGTLLMQAFVRCIEIKMQWAA